MASGVSSWEQFCVGISMKIGLSRAPALVLFPAAKTRKSSRKAWNAQVLLAMAADKKDHCRMEKSYAWALDHGLSSLASPSESSSSPTEGPDANVSLSRCSRSPATLPGVRSEVQGSDVA